MTDIDWSKAPEGATHWTPESGTWCAFLKKEGENWHWWNDKEWCKFFGNSWKSQLDGIVSRPVSWSGEGLPPVGVECEVQNPVDGSWCECKILVHEGQVAVFRADSNYPWVYGGADAGAFRPLQEKQP